MRFATATIAVFAGVAVAHYGEDPSYGNPPYGDSPAYGDEPASTAYETQYFTVTSCAPEVTDCPSRSTVVSSEIVPVTTSAQHPVVETPITDKPGNENPGNENPGNENPGNENPNPPVNSYSVPPENYPVPTLVPVYTSSALPGYETPGAQNCGAASIETITTYYTTVVPTVSYVTHSAPCETSAPPTPGKPNTPGTPSNGTIPSTTPIPTGAASTMGASAVLAVLAGAIAIFA